MQSFPWDSWAWGEDTGPQRQPTSPRQFPAWDLMNAGSRNPAGREKGVAGREEMEVPSLGPVIQSIFKKTLSARLTLIITLQFGAQKKVLLRG